MASTRTGVRVHQLSELVTRGRQHSCIRQSVVSNKQLNAKPGHSAAGFLHPNLNLENPEDDVDLNILVGKEKQQHDIDVALSNSFGFGGHNSCILFRKYTA